MSLGAISTAAIPAGVLEAQEEASAPEVVEMPAVSVQATPKYHHVAGSCEVPVYGTSVAVPILYQQSGAGLPTTEYLEPRGLSSEQMKTIFPLGAPDAFKPFEPSRCVYNIVETPEQCLPDVSVETLAPTSSGPATPLVAETASEIPLNAAEPPEACEAPAADGQKVAIKKKSRGCC